MPQTYAVCEKCGRTNRVELRNEKSPVCGACQAPLSLHGAVIDSSDHSLPQLIKKSPLPVVVDIWAPWCGPCRSFAPTFEEASQKFAGQVVFAKLNSDQNQQTSSRYGVRGIPTLLIFKNGVEVARQSGALPREYFSQWLEQSIK